MRAEAIGVAEGRSAVRGRFSLALGLILAAAVGAGSGCDASGPEPVMKPGATAGDSARKAAAQPRPVELVWPTPNQAFAEGHPMDTFIQPTVSGVLTSGLFGSVRSGGRQFHEGLDLLPVARDRTGMPLDQVGAAMAGVVRHVSARPGASSYGRYVVLEHPGQTPSVYTLYGHLADIAPGIVKGVEVRAGQALGTMGNSAGGYTIPKERAHLHFEVGVRMTDAFQAWYGRRGFGSPNEQGLYNGMNLMGLDPLEFFARRKAGGLLSLDEVFREIPAAVTLRIAHAGEPDFVRRYPSLVAKGAGDGAGLVGGGWEIDFSATGVPVRWRRPAAGEFTGWKSGEVRILAVDKLLLAGNRGRDLVLPRRGAEVPADDLRTVLQQLFDWRG